MKRKIILFSTLGAAAGLLFALENNRRKQTANRDATGDRKSSGDGKAPSIAKPDGSAQRGGSMARTENRKATATEAEAHQLDDHGTDQAQALHILQEIRDNAFDASDEKLAIALGRPTEEIEQWANGDGLIDGDVVLKARALAIQRGVEVE